MLCAAALLASTALVGCTQQRVEREPEPAPAPIKRGGWPTCVSNDQMLAVARAFPTGDPATSVVGLEKCIPRSAKAGQNFEYHVVVTNLATYTLKDVRVNDVFTGGMTFVSSTPEGQRTGDGVSWQIGDLAPQQSKKIVATGRAPDNVGMAGNCVTVEYNNQLCAELEVVRPELQITKSGPSEVLLCDPIDYTFVVTNSGSATIDDARVTDPLPEGLATAAGGREITFDVGTLRPGQSKEFKASVKAARRGTFTNKASASGGGVSAESGNVTTTVREPVLAITKTGPERNFLGRQSTYQITVTNTGDGEARDTVISDQFQGTFVSASDGGRATGNTITWNVGTLAPQGSKQVTMTVSHADAGRICNTATARAYCAKAVSAEACTNYEGIPAILLEVIDIEDPIPVGDEETYVITVTNQGSAPDTNIKIVCTLEAAQQYVRSAGPTTATARGNTIEFAPIPTLAPKERATFRVTVKAVSAGDVRFRTVMTSDQLGRVVEETEATNQYED